MDLFSQQPAAEGQDSAYVPLAERCRPARLEEFVGHEELIGPDTPLYKAIKQNRPRSLILWGPPGVGKTTLARIIANEVKGDFIAISAVSAGVSELRKIIDRAKKNRQLLNKATILFIDEIHRFNKAQQDTLLHAVEDGTLILIGATTENPSFEVTAQLLSRCQVYSMAPLTQAHIRRIVEQALKKDPLLIEKQVKIEDWEALYLFSGGDARRALNTVEKAVELLGDQKAPLRLTREVIEKAAQRKVPVYDRAGEKHYDLISAFIKSLRGSDPDAAIYYMARMLEAGEDPRFIARRMVILASEDIGNADPLALILATNCFTAVTYVGMPECRIILSQTAAYLAAAPKSNAAYVAIQRATKDVQSLPDAEVPLHLRNAPTKLLKQLDYGKGYQYPHDFPGHFVRESYLPAPLKGKQYYVPSTEGAEAGLRERLQTLWKGIKAYPLDQQEGM
ncbi:MAG: replication-associated recombination protein A, partial [Calditrichaeota bacterium]